MDWAAFGIDAALTLGLVWVLLTGTWLVALRVGRHAVVDVVWGAGFAVVARRQPRCWPGRTGCRGRRPGAAGRRPDRRVGSAARRPHRPAQPREGRGPALRRHPGAGDRQPGAAHVPPGLPDAGGGDVVRVAAGAGGDPPGRPALVGAVAGGHRARDRGVGRRAVLRGGRRLAARAIQGRPGQRRCRQRPRPLAVHAAPELLRRRLRVVGAVPAGRGPLVGVGVRPLARAHDVDAGEGHRRAADREADVELAPRLRRVRPAHERLRAITSATLRAAPRPGADPG